MMYLYNQVL